MMMKIAGVFLAFFLVLTNVLIITNFEPTYWVFQDGNKKEALHQTLGFLRGEISLPQGYTLSEASHLSDVRLLFRWINLIWVTLGLASLALISLSIQSQKQVFREAGFSLVSIVAILLIMAFFFNFFFESFHRIAFPNGNWIFPANSAIISMFPESFFIAAFLTIVGLTLIEGFVMIAVTLKKKATRKSAKSYRNIS